MSHFARRCIVRYRRRRLMRRHLARHFMPCCLDRAPLYGLIAKRIGLAGFRPVLTTVLVLVLVLPLCLARLTLALTLTTTTTTTTTTTATATTLGAFT